MRQAFCAGMFVAVLASAVATSAGPEPDWLAALRTKAQRGDSKAQLRLGEVYESGAGDIAADAQLAFAWYRRAAEGGEPEAQSALGAMYAFGRGTPQNHIEAV